MFKVPTDYLKATLVNKKRTKDVLENYQKYLKYSEKELILEVGSAIGNVTCELLLPLIPHSNFQLIGVDISQTFVDYANDTVKDPRVSFLVLDITEKNQDKLKSVFPEQELNNGFDKIFSFSVISWTKDYLQSFKNIYTLLKPGGQILIWFTGYFSFSDIWRDVIKKEKWHPYFKNEPVLRFPFHDSTDPRRECTDMLKRIGFQDIICDCLRKPQVTTLSEPWKYVVKGVNPYYHRVPEHLQEEYLNDCMEIFYHLVDKTDGLPYDKIIIVASKPTA